MSRLFLNVVPFGLLLVLEGTAFFCHAAAQVAPYYPPNWDQTSYLNASYHLVEAWRAGHFWHQFWNMGVPPGMTYQLQGAVLMLVFGAGRVAGLMVNFLWFAALQIVVWRTVGWMAR